MTLEEKLESFKDSAIEEASMESQLILAAHEENLKNIYQSQIEKARHKSRAQIQTKTDELMRSHNKRLSQEQNNIKREIREKHHEVKERIFKDVEIKLVEYTHTPEYTEKLIRQILEAKRVAKSDPVTIYVDPADADKVSFLEEKTAMAITISKTPFIGGMRAVIPAKNILIDHSFASRLDEAGENFAI